MSLDQYESAANIEFTINVSGNSDVGGNNTDEVTVPVASIDASKDVEIEQIRGNNLKPVGFSLTEIEYSGSVTFDGNGYVEVDGSQHHLEELFTNQDGIPVTESEIVITHEADGMVDGESAKETDYEDVMVTSDGYESDSGEVSGITFDWIASDRNRDDA